MNNNIIKVSRGRIWPDDLELTQCEKVAVAAAWAHPDAQMWLETQDLWCAKFRSSLITAEDIKDPTYGSIPCISTVGRPVLFTEPEEAEHCLMICEVLQLTKELLALAWVFDGPKIRDRLAAALNALDRGPE